MSDWTINLNHLNFGIQGPWVNEKYVLVPSQKPITIETDTQNKLSSFAKVPRIKVLTNCVSFSSERFFSSEPAKIAYTYFRSRALAVWIHSSKWSYLLKYLPIFFIFQEKTFIMVLLFLIEYFKMKKQVLKCLLAAILGTKNILLFYNRLVRGIQTTQA